MVVKIKKQKVQESVIKRRFKCENYKSCLEATQLENKLNYLEKNKIDIDSLKENYKQFIKNNKSILKTQQRFKNEMHNVLLKKLKIASSSNDEECSQLIG